MMVDLILGGAFVALLWMGIFSMPIIVIVLFLLLVMVSIAVNLIDTTDERIN